MNKRQYIERPTYKGTEIQVVERTVPEAQAQYAMSLMKHFGIVAGTPDGEDSSGRQKLRLATPKEIVERACTIAELAFQEFENRDWLLDLPAPKATEQ